MIFSILLISIFSASGKETAVQSEEGLGNNVFVDQQEELVIENTLVQMPQTVPDVIMIPYKESEGYGYSYAEEAAYMNMTPGPVMVRKYLITKNREYFSSFVLRVFISIIPDCNLRCTPSDN